ncbi:MAG: RNase adapter RapZ [Oleispira sp.]|nr:RNase adapter RapZ [Oleispira sp.]
MRLIIISGRSGSGKSAALHVLEDQGFYCIDNLPLGLLPALTEQAQEQAHHSLAESEVSLQKLAVSIDARNAAQNMEQFPTILNSIEQGLFKAEVLYLDASKETLMQRFSSTRRKHPLTNSETSLAEAITSEEELLRPISDLADLSLDTTHLSVHELRSLIKLRISHKQASDMALLFQSFGFKHGIPIDADLVFDVRNLPNPYWDPSLRQFTGRDPQIIAFLEREPLVQEMLHDIQHYLKKWLPSFEQANRSYMTVAIGCTGGHHRSVFISEALIRLFSAQFENVQVRHRELPDL